MLNISKIRHMPKILLHEHLDCSLRPETMLELWSKSNFNNPNFPFPENIVKLWSVNDSASRAKASRLYQDYLAKFASSSLTNYVKAIVDHVLPLMQSKENLYRITKERIEDALADGVVGFELRFAPQLHTMAGLTLNEVMDSVIRALDEFPQIKVKLIICALRHENSLVATDLVKLTNNYKQHVSGYDLAADESLNPGVLPWWLDSAILAANSGCGLTIHLWETNYPEAVDHQRLAVAGITRLGHGIKGSEQTGYVLEVCPTSNVVTGQVKSFKQHPIDKFLKQGQLVTVNTDGTLFTKVSLSREYYKLAQTFGWGRREFALVNETAIQASFFSDEDKSWLKSKLDEYFGS